MLARRLHGERVDCLSERAGGWITAASTPADAISASASSTE